MAGPPFDVAATLPQNWASLVLATTACGPEASFVTFLQEVTREQGDSALMVAAMQTLAEWACRDREDSTADTAFPRLRALLGRIAEHAGSWAVEAPLEERRDIVHAHPIEISRALESCEAEWRVLDYLIRHDWSVVQEPRTPGAFDWQVRKGHERLDVEVKQKAAIGSASHSMEWCLKGLSLLPKGRWMYNYRWHCDLPETARIRAVQHFVDAFRQDLDHLEKAIDREIENHQVWVDPELAAGLHLTVGPCFRGKNSAVRLALPDQGDPGGRSVQVSVDRNDLERVVWISGRTVAWVPPQVGEEEAAQLLAVTGRLGAAEQSRARATDGLFVFVWWMPTQWESAYDRGWMRSTIDRIADVLGLHRCAIWPLGAFELAGQPWVVNTGALGTLADLET